MLKGQDIVVLAALMGEHGPTIQWLADRLELDVASVHRSLKRLERAQLLLRDRRVNAANADDFLAHGLRYVFPPEYVGESRGVATAWAAAPLKDVFAPDSGPLPVWPHPNGNERGIAVEPLHKSVPAVALKHGELHQRLALIDALRMGDARQRREARSFLRSWLGVSPLEQE